MSKASQATLQRIESLLNKLQTTATKPLDINEPAVYLHLSGYSDEGVQ